MSSSLLNRARKYSHLSRADLAELLDITEYRVRELRREIRKEEEQEHYNDPFIAVWDLESTSLKGDFGRLLCGSILSYPSGKITTFRIDETNGGSPNQDGPLAVAIRDEIERHWVSCGWYSKGFDIPMLSTRLVVSGHKRIRPHLHMDIMWHYRGWRGISLRNSKLATVAKVLDLDEQKMDVPDQVWQEARYGDKYSLDIICDRCESDVKLTAKIMKHALENGLMKNITTYP